MPPPMRGFAISRTTQHAARHKAESMAALQMLLKPGDVMPIRRRHLSLAVPMLLAACGPTPVRTTPVNVTLPPGAVQGAGDPLSMAALNAASVFASPTPLSGRPADAAEAIAQMEYIVAVYPSDPRFFSAPIGLVSTMQRARLEWRGVLAIPATAQAQLVINTLYDAARALRGGRRDAAVLAFSPNLFTLGGEVTMQRLNGLPAMPATNDAAVAAQQVLGQGQQRQISR